MNDSFLQPEDYLEPRCLLCDMPVGMEQVKPVPQGRIIEKLDDYMSRRDYAGAERHLKYWLEEAKAGHDRGGALMIHNELVGHYRKTGSRNGAFEHAEAALRLVDELKLQNTVTAGTTYINAATACNAFGENERALALFERAAAEYEAVGSVAPEKLGGLYNNMGLTLTALGRYGEAYALFDKALHVMKSADHGALEQAITCLNIADAKKAELGADAAEQEIDALLDRAYDLLNTPGIPRDGYYAFVCEKCAPAFSYYGYFLAANELKKRSEAIYERA